MGLLSPGHQKHRIGSFCQTLLNMSSCQALGRGHAWSAKRNDLHVGCQFAAREPRSSVQRVYLQVYNPEGEKRVIVTKELPGERWLDILTKSGCRVEVSQHEDTILSNSIIKKLLGDKCHGVLGQLTEVRLGPCKNSLLTTTAHSTTDSCTVLCGGVCEYLS